MSIQQIKIVSKIINVNNSCALDALTMYLELLPKDLSEKIMKYFNENLRTLILKLKQQLYIDSNNFKLINRLETINRYFKLINNASEYDFISLDEILFENEKLLESGLITETAHDYKRASLQLINISNCHYVVKFCLKNGLTEKWMYLDDLDNFCYSNKNEEIVLIHNFDNMTEINNIFKKITSMNRFN